MFFKQLTCLLNSKGEMYHQLKTANINVGYKDIRHRQSQLNTIKLCI